jgi:signal transduction histidine kinase
VLSLTREQSPSEGAGEGTNGTNGAKGATDGDTEQGGESHAFVRVAVRDEGPGIPPAALSHLFERFYRVPGIEVQRGERQGLGLGLYISRQLIERHGGQLDVASKVGQGSTFSFTLPLADSAPSA